jgi:hypothetical protein
MTRRTILLAALALAACVMVGCGGDGATPVAPSAFIRVVSPNGGEKWAPGTDHEIIWVSQYVGGTVLIEYSTDDFVSDVNLIASEEPNDGSFTWENVPSDPSDNVRVRVSWTGFPGVSDMSDGDFRIGDFGWAQTWGGSNSDYGSSVAADGSGNVYVTGAFYETMDFGPVGGDLHTSNGKLDVFLVKLNSSGDFIWGRTWGGPESDDGRGVAVDGSGNVYATGGFYETIDFGPAGGDPHTSNGRWDVFLVKFNSTGDFVWACTWGGPASDMGLGAAADGSGDVYVTGRFGDTADFDPGGGDPHTSNGDWDIFLSKFDSSGNFDWARTWGGSYGDDGLGVATDGSGNVFVVGLFWRTVDFDPGGGDPHTTKGPWFPDAFLSKFDSWGNFEWARTWGGRRPDYGFGVAADGSGSVYVTGYFCETADFDPGGGDPHTSNGDADVFLSKFDASGNFEWVRTWGGARDDGGRGVAADGSGNVCVTGFFNASVDFDPDGGDSYTSNGELDAFLSRFDSSGNFEWVRTWGGLLDDYSNALAFDSVGNVYSMGVFGATVDFSPTGPPCNEDPDEHVSNGYSDAFLVKYLPDGCW